MDTVFLALEELLEIHLDQIERYGGRQGVRDMGLLRSAAAMPISGSGAEYHHKNIFEQAAAHLFHIVKNHPFVDGNKRAGAVAAYAFLSLNKISLEADENEFEEMVLSVAEGNADKKAIAEFFRKNSRKRAKGG